MFNIVCIFTFNIHVISTYKTFWISQPVHVQQLLFLCNDSKPGQLKLLQDRNKLCKELFKEELVYSSGLRMLTKLVTDVSWSKVSSFVVLATSFGQFGVLRSIFQLVFQLLYYFVNWVKIGRFFQVLKKIIKIKNMKGCIISDVTKQY